MKRALYATSILILVLACLAVVPAHAQGGTYVVRPGDSLIGIAARHGVSVSALASANGLRANGWVYVGQRLKIPGQASASAASAPAASAPAASAPAASATGGTYVVQRGDSLSGIATRHGVTVSQLASANGLRANGWVYVGQRLKIPGGSSSRSSSTPPSAPTTPAPTTPASSGTYVIRLGDSLISIAARYGVSVGQLASANGLYPNSWVYIGQRLKIPGQATSPPSTTPAPSTGGTYVVRPGDSLVGIAARHGIGVSQLASANGLRVDSWVYVGQRLSIPGQGSTQPSKPTPAPVADGTKWIDINLTTQTLTAYAGNTAVYEARVSTGTWRTPTVVGTFRVYAKYPAVRMRGPGYDLPNVPYTMYFYRGYALHGTYWHSNFGTPMSHGCVNLPTPDAQWLYNWAPMDTKVVTHP
ncbi:MAG: LysM peptidoglycan-binding domain-containing protein [Chloroflexi bacterium]|nr:LysM peptidoglycan-binding domain-containing protein [Chloroflexota bacterium]MBL7199939.1 LysM peptidoglycan-binding domain-containing protein [Anaerolineae bacterium]